MRSELRTQDKLFIQISNYIFHRRFTSSNTRRIRIESAIRQLAKSISDKEITVGRSTCELFLIKCERTSWGKYSTSWAKVLMSCTSGGGGTTLNTKLTLF